MLISNALSRFAHGLRAEDVPDAVVRRAKLLILDAIGIAFSSSTREFARIALAGVSRFGDGNCVAIGLDRSLSVRDAVLINGILVHGLDYDDTYLPGGVHMTASNVPCALGVASETRASGREFLAACIVGLETAARVGLGGKGLFQTAGFHPTSICGTMSSSLVAGRLMGLDQIALCRAQGIALSMASGSMQPVQDGTWTKRMHPGWAAAAGITAASLAEGGFTGPAAAYEGRFGIYKLFLGPLVAGADPSLVTQELGETWEFIKTSIKLYPACHQSHAFINAAIKIVTDNELCVDDIQSVTTLVAETTRDLVCEPADAKSRPDSSYLAQFSLPYAMAASLTRRQFGLAEIEEPSYTDPRLIALAQKVHYQIDPRAGYPKTRTGEVVVAMRNGTLFRERNEIRPEEPASETSIVAKFMANCGTAISLSRATEVHERILSIENEADVNTLCRLLASRN